jgi:crotonobetainyl-CoA:carnitine CoA-transferase CaiB-like acyl-CoA transferase
MAPTTGIAFIELGIPAGPINDLAEAFALARHLGLAATVAVPGTHTPQVANPVELSATPVTYRHAPPALGRHRPV